MSGQWKPGDVATASASGRSFLVVRTFGGNSGDYWSAPHGWPKGVSSDEIDLRPLLVIDVEDREQVERLVGAWASKFMWLERVTEGDVDCAQDALRSLLAPPRPEEPKGLGAVVRDANGDLWVRRSDVHFICPKNPNEALTWAEVEAVEVLSEGWSE